ncbi:MAG: transglutaminase N-terminal domain-containing protein [Hyphomicrobium sp.]
MIFEISHKTLYRYDSHVAQSQHLIHMSPRAAPFQTVRRHSLLVEPAPAVRLQSQDMFGNPTILLEIEAPHKDLSLQARSTVETQRRNIARLDRGLAWDALEGHLTGQGAELDLNVIQYRCASRLTTPSLEIADYAAVSFATGRPVLDGAMDLTRRIFTEFKFDRTATDISTPISEVLRGRRGVCQDFAHLSLAALRAHRIPARYVSGYILTHVPPGRPKLQGADASHAWISVWSPEQGWVDFDPTNGVVVDDEHITVAIGRDYDDVCPISGVLIGGGEHTVTVGVDVTPVQ